LRCGGTLGPHLYDDVASKRQRKRVRRQTHPYVAKRPEAERIPPQTLARSADPVFGHLYRRVRLVCPAPNCGGYMVVRGRADRRFKFTGCSSYNETHCKATLGSWEYVERKAAVVDDLIAGRPPRYPIRFVQPKPRAPKKPSKPPRRAPRDFGA